MPPPQIRYKFGRSFKVGYFEDKSEKITLLPPDQEVVLSMFQMQLLHDDSVKTAGKHIATVAVSPVVAARRKSRSNSSGSRKQSTTGASVDQ
jgi:hypothetical protein